MKKIFISVFSILFFAVGLSKPVSAQFKGNVTFHSVEYADNGSQSKQHDFTLSITPKRMLLTGDAQYKLMGKIQTKGILLRQDMKDIVILTGNNTALQVSKSNLSSMMKMFNVNGSSHQKGNIDYKNTGDQKNIDGYSCTKFIFRDKDKPNKHMEVWMTKDLNINWGMLTDDWGGKLGNMISSYPTQVMFKENYFPLLAKGYEGSKLTSTLQASNVEETEQAEKMVQIPPNTNVVKLQRYLFQKMSQQQ